MTNIPHTAMVLAAGLGTRMRPLTNRKPKPLIRVSGHALIDYALDRFAAAGVTRTVVNVHYLADQIEQHLTSRDLPEIIIADEREELLETGGGLKNALSLLGDEPIFCTNTDAILMDPAGEEACALLREHWDPDLMDALLLLVPIDETSGYGGEGDFHLDADNKIRFRSEGRAPFVFTGLQIISTDLIKTGPEGAFSTKHLWEHARQQGRLSGVVHNGYWMHVGDRDGLNRAEKLLQESA